MTEMARGKGYVVVLLLVLLLAKASVQEDWTGRQASGMVEDFYLQALSALTGVKEFSGLSASDLKWLFSRISTYGPDARDGSSSVFSRGLVKEFLCSRRGICETVGNLLCGRWGTLKVRKLEFILLKISPFSPVVLST